MLLMRPSNYRADCASLPPEGPGRLTPEQGLSGMAFTVTCAARLLRCNSDEAAGLANATARVLAPSKEALDTPLSPPPLSDEPGPATGHSGAYPNGTPIRRPGPASRTHHGQEQGLVSQPGHVCEPRRRVRVGPLLADQSPPMPGQQGSWCHDPVQAQVPGQHPSQGGTAAQSGFGRATCRRSTAT